MGCIKNLKRKSDHFIFNDILLNWHFNAFSCIFLYTIYLDHCHPLIPLPHSSGISTSTFMSLYSDPEIPIKDAQMRIGVGHLLASGQPTSGHTLEEDPPTLTSHQLPTAPYLGKEFRSLCLVHAGLLTDVIFLGHVLSGSPLLLYMSSEGSSQVMSRRQHFVTLCDSFRLLCSFITLLQLCSVVVGYKNIDCRTEHSIVTILSTLTI